MEHHEIPLEIDVMIHIIFSCLNIEHLFGYRTSFWIFVIPLMVFDLQKFQGYMYVIYTWNSKQPV